MTYAMPALPKTTESEVRSRKLVVPCPHPVTGRPAANEDAPAGAGYVRPVDPMLLVYQERVETFRLIVAALRRGIRALGASFAN